MLTRAAFAIGSIAWIATLFCARGALAQPIRNRALEGLVVERSAQGWRLRVRFRVPIRYLRHSPRDRGDAIQIQLSPLDGLREEPLPIGTRESLHIPPEAPIPLSEVTLESGGERGPILTVRLQRTSEFRVLPGDDLRSVLIEFPAASGAARRLPPRPAAGTPGRAAELVADGRRALTAGEFERAIQLFTKVLSLPEEDSTREARELLGLARERNGQLAHAVAEYKDYLERYPVGEDAERVRQRLAALVTADARPAERIRERTPESSEWEVDTFGSLYVSYRRESRFVEDLGEALIDSSLLTDAFASTRARSEFYTLRSEFSGGYRHDFLDAGSEDYRVSSLFVEAADHRRDLLASLGRRSRSSGGVLGRYDGGRLAKRFRDRWEVSAVAGLPVASPSSFRPDTGKVFGGVALDVAKLFEAVDAQLFAIHQVADGENDRSAVGGEFRYFRDGRFVAGIVDFDLLFRSLNIAQLIGNWQVAPSLFLNALADYRNLPSISLSNALIGQAADDLDELRESFSRSEIESLASDRTAKSLTLTIGASQDLRPDLQLAFDFSTTNLEGTDTSGGVEGLEGTGFEFSYFAQVIANELLRTRDIGVLGLRFFDGSGLDAATASFDYRFPLTDRLRVNPRLAGELRLDGDAPDTFELRPTLRCDWHLGRIVLDAEAGVGWMVPTAGAGLGDDWGYYASAGLRYDF